jgi:hypothetical protein
MRIKIPLLQLGEAKPQELNHVVSKIVLYMKNIYSLDLKELSNSS